LNVPADVFDGNSHQDAVPLEEPVEFVPGLKTEQAPQFGLGEVAALEFFECQAFQCAPPRPEFITNFLKSNSKLLIQNKIFWR